MGDPAASVDAMLDANNDVLQYFKTLLGVGHLIDPGYPWKDWQRDFCRRYDNEKGIDIEALESIAVRVGLADRSALVAVSEQGQARDNVQTAWPDAAGHAALTTLNTHQGTSVTVADAVKNAALAADGVVAAIRGAVDKKTRRLSSEFTEEHTNFLSSVTKALISNPEGGALHRAARDQFIKQYNKDVATFDAIITEAQKTITSAYESFSTAAAPALDSTFPNPSFGNIAQPPPPSAGSPAAPGVVAPVGGGGPSGGGGAAPNGGGKPVSAPSMPGTGKPAPTSGAEPTAQPATTKPAPTKPTATPSTPAASGAPGGGMPGAGQKLGEAGMPSWLSQLLPKIMDQIGKGKDGKDDLKDAKKDPLAKDGKESVKDGKAPRVTAALRADGKTIDVTVTNPDGTTSKATLKIGEDGKLTMAEEPKKTDPAAGQGAKPTSAVQPGSPNPHPDKPTPAAPAGGTKPGGTTPSDAGGTAVPSAGGAHGSSTGGAQVPGTGAPSPASVPAPSVKPAPKPPASAAQSADEACPPEPATPSPGTGAEIAITVP